MRALSCAQKPHALQLRALSSSAYRHHKHPATVSSVQANSILPFKDRDDTRCFWPENDIRIPKVGFIPFGASLPIEDLGDIPAEQLQIQMQFYFSETQKSYEIQDLKVQKDDYFFQVRVGDEMWSIPPTQFVLKSDEQWVKIDEISSGDEVVDAFGDIHLVDEVTRIDEAFSTVMLEVVELTAVPLYQPVINKIIKKYHNYLKKQERKQNDKPRKSRSQKKPSAEKKITKQRRLLGLLVDDRQPSYIRGHVKNDLHKVSRGICQSLHVPAGRNLAHHPCYEDAKGFDYTYTALQMADLHIIQHKHDAGGRKNKKGKIHFSQDKFFYKVTFR